MNSGLRPDCPKCKRRLIDGIKHGYDFFCRFCRQGYFNGERGLVPVDINTVSVHA